MEPTRSYRKLLSGIGLAVVLSILLCATFLLVFPKSQAEPFFSIRSGDSVRAIAASAKEAGHIRSELGFLVWYKVFYADTPIVAGQYTLPESLSLPEFVATLTTGDITEAYLPLTFPEGITIARMVEILRDSGTTIDTDAYQALLADSEGYAFPDTYFVTEATTAEELVAMQRAALEEARAPFAEQIAASTLTEAEIITLASIIEREANDDTSMKMVSGILQNRLEIGMPLQADASIEYVLDKPLAELTPSDLDIDSPYNTYLYRGLPPTPIGNPGTRSIAAVLNPTVTDNFYYITGRDGVFYYARTLDEHNDNIARYLR